MRSLRPESPWWRRPEELRRGRSLPVASLRAIETTIAASSGDSDGMSARSSASAPETLTPGSASEVGAGCFHMASGRRAAANPLGRGSARATYASGTRYSLCTADSVCSSPLARASKSAAGVPRASARTVCTVPDGSFCPDSIAERYE